MLEDCSQLALSPISHVGVVVRDVGQTGVSLHRVFGVDFDQVFDYGVPDRLLLEGHPFSLKIAVAKIGADTYEFLQPVEGRSIWADFLDSKGEGTHHVAFKVKDWDNKVALLQSAGARLIAGARVEQFQGKRWAYFDTGVGGLVVELMEDYEI